MRQKLLEHGWHVGAEPSDVLGLERDFLGRGREMRSHDVRILGMQHGVFDGSLEEQLRVLEEETVQRILSAEQHDESVVATSTGPARLLPESAQLAGVSGDEHRVHA